MGSDALQSEEAMRRMWGDSMKAVKCQNARITYDDFLLLMKGQTRELPLSRSASPVHHAKDIHDPMDAHQAMPVQLPSLVASTKLHVVPELERTETGGESPQKTAPEIMIPDASMPTMPTPPTKSSPAIPMRRAVPSGVPSLESPLSMDNDDDLRRLSGPGIAGSVASLTPPSSPVRGATDYVTPRSGRKTIDFVGQGRGSDLDLPGLEVGADAYGGRGTLTRKRSVSLDDRDKNNDNSQNDDSENKNEGNDDLHAVADIVRDMLLPETDHTHLHNSQDFDELAKDKTKSALVVNRTLYRAHRQMRLAVLEASKRFEEQQTQHAKEVLLARQQKEVGAVTAGLVMRHGEKKQVTSEAIRKLLSENKAQQQQLVALATKKGGRGRRSRKKTISDMSAMLSSIGQDEMTAIATEAQAQTSSPSPPPLIASQSTPVAKPEQVETPARAATVPGEFRSTTDPFGLKGKYGAIANPAI